MEYQSVLNYVTKNFPNHCILSEARLIKMLYLMDWRSAITRKKQLTNLKWVVGENGPQPSINIFGEPLDSSLNKLELDVNDKLIVDFVIKTTVDKKWKDLNILVDSTYPVFMQLPLYSDIELVKIAGLYKDVKNDIAWDSKIATDSDWNSNSVVNR